MLGMRAAFGLLKQILARDWRAIHERSKFGKIFYGWWVVAAAFLNLFFVVGIIFYGFPVFYASFVESLGFTRAQVTQGFFLGFLIIGLPSGFWRGRLLIASVLAG